MPDTSKLNAEQKKAVTHGAGPLLIIAGAGTGKTTVITKRIEHLILEEKISTANILALTFTEKAAQEMVTRVDEILPYGYTDMWIETFHAFCDRILRAEAIHIGLNPRYNLMTEAEALLFLRKRIFDFELDYFRPLGNPTKFLQGMLGHFSRLKDDDITPEQYLTYAEKLSKTETEPEEIKKTLELAKSFKLYESMKAKEGVMDFSDLISNTLLLFRKRPNVLKQYQKLFQYVLVDEFQDTNFAQNEMAMLLAGEKQNITVVGDDDQSIYRWRGAAIANMMQFRAHFKNTTIVTLTKNYRCTQNILDGAYQLIQYNNPDRLEIKEKIDKKLSSMREIKGEPIEFLFTSRVEEEAELVAKKIKEEVKKTNRPYNEFAILIRANDHSIPFQRALDRAHIPFQFLGPGRLFQQEEIKDLIAYLHTLVNFEDTSSLYRVLTMPIFDLQPRDVASLLNSTKRNNYTLFEAMEQVEDSMLTRDGKEKVTRIITMIKKHLKMLPRETGGQILYYFFEESGLLGHYLDPRSVRTEKEAENIAKFFEKLKSFAANRDDASVFAVVDWLDLAMELGESPLAAEIDWTRNNAVNILTIHSSKGLEFPFVFVVNLVTQRFPSRDRKEQIPVPQDIIRETLPEKEGNIGEERRLFYVAITRAKDKLYLTASRFYSEAKRERKISPFVSETLSENILQQFVKKQAVQDPGQQLSLLDVFNATLAEQEKKPPEEKPVGYVPSYVSYSQLQTFQVCPLHYKLRYILNVPTAPTSALSYGISVHSTLRDFVQLVKDGQEARPNMMPNILKDNWIPLGYAGKSHAEQAQKQAGVMLTDFATKYLEEKPNTLAIELPFNFWLKNTLKVGGRIDRIDTLPDGRVEIIDYKTGPNVPTEKKVREDFQLSFYALAATEVHDTILNKKPEEIVLTFHYLEADKKLSTTRTADELQVAKDKILKLVEDISTSDFHCSGGRLCQDCEYKMVCQGKN